MTENERNLYVRIETMLMYLDDMCSTHQRYPSYTNISHGICFKLFHKICPVLSKYLQRGIYGMYWLCFRAVSLALMNGGPSASETTLENMGEIDL